MTMILGHPMDGGTAAANPQKYIIKSCLSCVEDWELLFPRGLLSISSTFFSFFLLKMCLTLCYILFYQCNPKYHYQTRPNDNLFLIFDELTF